MTNTKHLRELLEKATPRPWCADQVSRILPVLPEKDVNAKLIVEAVNSLPALLDRIEEQERTIAALRKALGECNEVTSHDE